MVLTKLLEPIGWGLLIGGLLFTSYQSGKLKERQWWRHELASRNEEVKATMLKLGQEADDLDERLLRIVEGDRAQLEDAQSTIKTLNARKPEEIAKSFSVDPGSLCKPVPVTCLQRLGDRGADGGAQARILAASRPAAGR